MRLNHIVVATDETDAGRSAARMGLDLANRVGARLTFMTVVSAELEPALVATACDRLATWLEADLGGAPAATSPDIGAAFGIPGIEICRFAEDRGADLLVLGRKARTRAARLLLGDTADAVARRSLVPSLYVPPGAGPIRRMLVALDGSERGMIVFRRASLIAVAIGASLSIVTVEPAYANEPESLAEAIPTARSQALMDHVAAPGSVLVRRGDVVAQVLAAVDEADADVLAVGYRRGGPPGGVEGGSIARRLAHQAPCAFLAVPL